MKSRVVMQFEGGEGEIEDDEGKIKCGVVEIVGGKGKRG